MAARSTACIWRTDMAQCKQCGRTLTADEIALHKRLINRGAKEHLCLSCLAGFYSCSEKLLMDKIDYFRSIGCQLFVRQEEEDEAARV